jgi:hypothetical protein
VFADIVQQPQALRELATFYERGEGAARLAELPRRRPPYTFRIWVFQR